MGFGKAIAQVIFNNQLKFARKFNTFYEFFKNAIFRILQTAIICFDKIILTRIRQGSFSKSSEKNKERYFCTT